MFTVNKDMDISTEYINPGEYVTFQSESFDPYNRIVTSNVVQSYECLQGPCISESTGYWDFLSRPEVIFFIVTNVIVLVLFLAVYIMGINSPAYLQLIQTEENMVTLWIARVGWIVATALSYLTYFFLRNESINIMLKLYNFYLINNLIVLLWAITIYQAQNLVAGVWLTFILLAYNFWLFLYVWTINPFASIWLLPLIIMYSFLAFEILQLAEINGQTL